MKTFQKMLCVMLSILMAFSCVSVVAFAQNGESFTTTFKTQMNVSEKEAAKETLDMIDGILAEENICEEVVLSKFPEIKITIDLRNINALCNTVDEYVGILKFATVIGALVLGDLKDLDLSTWRKDMERPDDDVTILNEFIELLNANKDLVSGICDASIDLGIFKSFLDVKALLGEDGISGMIKEEIIDMVYDDESPEFDVAYEAYKNDIDSFIYGDLLNFFTAEAMPGLSIDSSTTIERILIDVYNIVYKELFKDMLMAIDVDLSTSDIEELRALGEVVNLQGSTYENLDSFYLETSGLKAQVNDMLGKYVKLFVPGFNGWENGGYENLKTNLENVIKYVADETGIIKNSASKTLEEIAIEIAMIIINKGDFGAYENGLAECKNLEEMASALLRNTAEEMEIGVNYKGNESYLVVLGDMLAATAYDVIPFTDTKGKVYYAGGGKDVFEVCNYIANYFLFDRKGAGVLGLSSSKEETIFTKLDKIIDYFGQNKAVNFSTKDFILGTADKKGLFDCIFTLDIAGLLELTVISALDGAGSVSAIEFIYKTVQYFFNNWAGKSLFPAYQSKAFTNAISNESIANMVSVLLETVNSRKADVVSMLTYIVALTTKPFEETECKINEAIISDCYATGEALSPKATVKAGDKTLVQGTDYVVLTDALVPGTAVATIKGIGYYSGKLERSFNVLLEGVSAVNYSSASDKITLSWNEVPFADSYKISKYNNATQRYEELATVEATSYTVTGLEVGGEYKFAVSAVDNVCGESEAKEVVAYTAPAAVSASGVSFTSTPTTITFNWQAVPGATEYKVERKVSGGWKTVATVQETTAVAKSLSSFTSYTFRITALKKLADGTILSAEPVSVSAKTSLAVTSSLKASSTDTTVTLTWKKVSKATEYEILRYTDGKWEKIATASGTTYKVTGLKSATQYKLAVCAIADGGARGSQKEISVYTALSKPASFKAASSTVKSVKLTWKAVSGATEYKIEQKTSSGWKTVATTDKTTATVSSLSSYTGYTFRITAYKKLADGTNLLSAAVTTTAKTAVAVTSSLKATYTDTTVTLTWSKVSKATKYEVLRYTNGAWKKLATVSGTSYKAKGLKAATNYKFAVRAVVVEGSKWVRGADKTISVYTGPSKPASVKASSTTTTTAKLTWSKVSKASSYEVYAYVGGKWVKKASTKKTSATVSGLPSGSKVKIKVRAIAKLGGKTVYGTYSSEVTALTLVGKVSGLKASERKTTSIAVKWNKTTGATSYEVYRYTGGKWKKIGTTTKTTYTDTKSLKKGTEYQYKVRAVQKVNSKTTRYGAYSSVLKAKTTIFGTARY